MRMLPFGSTIREVIYGAYRVFRTDDDGYIEVVPAAGALTDVNVTELGGDAISQVAGVQNVSVVSAPETDMDLVKVGGTAVADAADGVVPVSSRLQIISGPTSIFDDGAGAKEAITDDYADNASGFINLDDRTTDLSIIVDKDTANPTSLEVEVLWDTLDVAGGAAIATAFYMPAVNSVGMIKGRADVSPLEVSWDGRAAAALPDGRYRWVFQRPAEAASFNVRIKSTGGAGTEAQVWAIELA
jgi:hypothetical protein